MSPITFGNPPESDAFTPVPANQRYNPDNFVQMPKLPPKPRKRLIVCCDGTWQSSSHGNRSIPSNVAKISRSVASCYVDDQGLMAPQIVYYDAGVGTAMGMLDKIWSGAYLICGSSQYNGTDMCKVDLARDWTKTSARRTISSSTTTPKETKSSFLAFPGVHTPSAHARVLFAASASVVPRP
jgi:hypothetical protein